jgi:hypothetical protein
MSDLSITASQVLPDDTGSQAFGTAGTTITAGQVVYLDSATNTWKLFDANDTAANTASPGIALNGASSGQPVKVQTSGSPVIGAGAAPSVGVVYVASATPGGIAPSADIVTGWRVAILGVGAATNAIKLSISNSGQTKP